LNIEAHQTIRSSTESESLVAQFASGSLSSGMSLIMASLMSYRPELQNEYESVTALQGQLLDECSPSELREDALSCALNTLDAASNRASAEHRAPKSQANDLNTDIALPLRSLLPDALEKLKWRYAYPGVKQVVLNVGDAGEEVTLLKIKPGKGAPRHTHSGLEATLILRGHYRDDQKLYGPGELALADSSTHHQPRAEGEEYCYCLAVTSGDLKVTDSYTKMVRDFFSI